MLIVALMIVLIVGFMGLTIDVGRLYLTRQELQTYADAATLAGARMLPYGTENPTTLKNKVDAAVQRALQTYAQNVGVDIDTLPAPPYSYLPAWNVSGENMKYTYDMVLQDGGQSVSDRVVITVFYHDALTIARDLPKERCILVEASREIPMIFAGLLGPNKATAQGPGGAFRGVFDVKWKFYTRADVHGTPIYHVDRDGLEKVYTVSKDGFLYTLDAWGDESIGRTWAYWKFKVLGESPWGERHLCYPYTGKFDCEPLGQSESNANYAIIGSPVVVPSISLESPCSTQTATNSGCTYSFTVLNRVNNGNGTTTLSVKVCTGSTCTNALSNVAISLPSGVVPSWPTHGSTYTALKSYSVENTTNNPFYSIKYNTSSPEGIKSGQCDVFRYTIPTASAQYGINIQAKASTKTYSTTFANNCAFYEAADNGQDLVIFASYPLSDDTKRGRLYALDSTTGAMVWSTPRYVGQKKYQTGAYGFQRALSTGGTELYIDAAPAFSPDGSVVYYPSRDGNLYAFNVDDGSNVWASDCDGGGPGESCFAMTAGTFATPYVHPVNGTIYVGTSKKRDTGTGTPKTDRGVIHAINPADGTAKWTWYPDRTGDGFNAAFAAWPEDNPTVLYATNRDKRVYKLNISGASPSQVWEYLPPSSLTAPDGRSANPQAPLSAKPVVAEEDGNLWIYFPTESGAAFKIRDLGSSVTATGGWGVWLGYDIDTTASPPGTGTGGNIRRAAYMSPAITDEFLYFGVVTEWDVQCAFQAVRRDDGQIMQSFVMNNDTHSSLRAAGNGWLYYASCDNYTYGVDTNVESLDSRLIR